MLLCRFKNVPHPFDIQLQVVIHLLNDLLHVHIGIRFGRCGKFVVQHKTDDHCNEHCDRRKG
ncbi:hypothetical protein D3C75_1009890 [compost metagenome]